MAFNQKSGVSSRTLVKKGDVFTPRQVLAASSYTDDNGVQNMGLNARIGLVPWKGFSMDDAIPISESFAKRLSAIQYKVVKQDSTDNLKTGLNHYRALFPTKFTKEKLEAFDSDGLVKPGTVLEPGDPILLATLPRTLSSAGANVGKLSKALMQSRRDASQVWHGNQQATVIASRKTKNGYKVVMKYLKPTEEGDKIVLRQGAKATVSKIIPDDRMPRTEDGEPLDAMLNPLSLVSRANPASQHELRLGKVAKKLGTALKIPSYLPKGESWNDYIDKLEADNGIQSRERVYDPETNRFLSEPITVGYGFVNKLHHTSESKQSSRGTGSYDLNEQPTRGGGDMAGAKSYSGLENYATLSSGAYALMRENSTLRGQSNHDFWRALRSDKPLPKVNEPFVWHKFRALLAGAGMNTRETGKGRYRLAPFTDKDLDDVDPVDVDNGEMVNLSDLSPVSGGLFDGRLLNGERWGRVRLPRPIINPAMEDTVRVMLGLTKNQLDDVLAGRKSLEEVREK
jgi:DNA-directed RNA polymerase subunit beta